MKNIHLLLIGLLSVGCHTLAIGDWNVTMEKNCVITASHPKNAQAFVSEAQFLQVGAGDVDKITIIKNGDIQQWPKEANASTALTCSEVSTPTSFKVTGTIQAGTQQVGYTLSIEPVAYSNLTLKIKVNKPKLFTVLGRDRCIFGRPGNRLFASELQIFE